MTRSQITKAVKMLVEAAALATEARWSEQSFSTLHLTDDLRRAQFAVENRYARFMDPIFRALPLAEQMALSTRLHRLAGV